MGPWDFDEGPRFDEEPPPDFGQVEPNFDVEDEPPDEDPDFGDGEWQLNCVRSSYAAELFCRQVTPL